MPSSAAPYGMRPVNLLGGRVFTHSVRQIPIASTYNTSIFTGDVVKLVTAGTVEKDASTNACTPVGVFLGVEYTDPNLNYLVHRSLWPASTVATDAMAYVVDDPDALFQIQCDGSGAQAILGSNVAIVQTAGTTTFGISKNAADVSTTTTTNTFPLRVIDFVEGPDQAVGDSYTDIIVKWNPAVHQYNNSAGI